jgi:PAS domain S-box-containing protein
MRGKRGDSRRGAGSQRPRKERPGAPHPSGLRTPRRPPGPPASLPDSKSLLDVAGVMFVGLDACGRVTLANRKACAILGVVPEEILGKDWFDHVLPDRVRAEVKAVHRRMMAGEMAPVEYTENVVKTRSGRERLISWHNTLLLDGAGRIAGTLSSGEDVTEHRRAETALHLLAMRHEAILQEIPDIVMEVDANKVYTWANPAGLAFFGGEALGREASHYFEGTQDTYATVQPLFNGDASTFYVESWQRRKDGAKRLLAWWCRAIRDAGGRVTGALSTARDITDQRRTEHSLREAEERFRGFFDNAPVGKSMTAPDGRLLRVNPALCAMLGYSAEELTRLTYAQITHPDDLAESRECVRSLLAGERNQWVMDKRYVARDGRTVWTNVTTCLQRDTQGNPVHFLTHILDITAKIQLAHQLQESERKHRALFENAQVGIFRSSLDGSRFLDVNPRLAEILGYAGEELAGLAPATLWAEPGARDRMVARLRADGRLEDFEVVIRRKNGDLRTNLVSMRLDNEGGFIEGTAVDITEHRRAEAALRESEARARFLADLVETSEQPIGTGYPDGRLGTCNRAFCELTGYSEKELKTINWAGTLTPPEWLESERKALAELERTGQPVRYQKEYLRKDGRRVPIELFVHLVRDASGRVEHYYSFVTDITERLRAEERLRHLNAVLLAIRNVNQLIVREKDPKTLIAEACRLLVETRGYRSAWIARLDDRRRLVDFAEAGLGACADPFRTHLDRDGIPTCCARALETDSVVVLRDLPTCKSCPIAPEYRGATVLAVRLAHAGRVHGVLVAAFPGEPVMDEEERALFQEMAGDIAFALHAIATEAEQRRAEAEHGRLHAQLLQSQKVEAVGRLAGGIAHDFNNILAVVLGHLDALLREPGVTAPQRGHADRARDAARRAVDITRRLLTFSRQETARPRVIDLSAVVADTEQMLRRLIGEDVELVTRLHPGPVRVKADPGQVGQVLLNLAVNARDAMPAGGRMTLATAVADLAGDDAAKAGLPPGAYAELSIADTGCGMTPEVKARLFEPFFTTKEREKGTGLGLSIVYGIVKQAGGGIEVESEPGRGATFRIRLPATAESPETVPAPPAEAAAPPPRGTETLLVVEDEESLRQLIVEILRVGGYRVLEASGGNEALRMAETEGGDIHLLVTDVIMPRMSGRELAERLAKGRPALKVIYMSGYTDDALAPHGRACPETPFLQKPFSLDDLLRRVREVLDAG